MNNNNIMPCIRCGKSVGCPVNEGKCSGEHECWFPIGCNKTPCPEMEMWGNLTNNMMGVNWDIRSEESK